MTGIQDLKNEITTEKAEFTALVKKWEGERKENEGAAMMVDILPLVFRTVQSRIMGPGSGGKTCLVYALDGKDPKTVKSMSRSYDMGFPDMKGHYTVTFGEKKYEYESIAFLLQAQPGQKEFYDLKYGFAGFTRTFILAAPWAEKMEDTQDNFAVASKHLRDEFLGRPNDTPKIVVYAVTKIDINSDVKEAYSRGGETAAIEKARALWPTDKMIEATAIDGYKPILGVPVYTSAYEAWGLKEFITTCYLVNTLNKMEVMTKYCQDLNKEGLRAVAKILPEGGGPILSRIRGEQPKLKK